MSKNFLIKARERSNVYQNISFVNEDAENLNLGQKFDCITASYLPKYCNPNILIQTCLEHLNDGGKIIFHDFTYPEGRFLQKCWNVYLKTLLVTSLFIPNWKNVIKNLPCLIKESKWVQNYDEMMKSFGLKTQTEFLTLGSSAIVIGNKPV
jgi:demethylmenaquinone methyltransferase/2-methoxy-6-polyprenyl-1,4-benzoquinol methylase